MDLATSQAAFAEALLDPGHALPEGITCVRGKADPARFAVYRNNVHVGLTGALAKRFPVVRRLVGEDFFAGMARVYAGLHKPASPLLFQYGDGFPEFIEQFEPAQGLAYLADVARIEAAWTKAYHAEDAEPLAVAKLAALEPDTLHRARFSLHPAASLLSSAFPAGSIWAAHQNEHVAPVKMQRAETVLVARPMMDVAVHIVPSEGAVFAEAVFAGESLGAAAERACTLDSGFDFGTALVGLVSLGAFTAIMEEEPQS
jgi:hypothetical protein